MDIRIIASSSQENCYRIADAETSVLLEAGLPLAKLRRELKHQLGNVAGVLVSHEHMDHARSVEELMKAGVECFMSGGTAGALGVKGHRLNLLKIGRQFRIGTFEIMPFGTIHDAAEPLGFMMVSRIEEARVLFATDTATLPYRFIKLTEILVECNYQGAYLNEAPAYQRERLISSHMSLETLCEFLKETDCKWLRGIWLLHVSKRNANREEIVKRVAGIVSCPVY